MEVTKEILQDALTFHGHKCWASTAGVRIGLAAMEALDKEWVFMQKRSAGVPPTEIPKEEQWELQDQSHQGRSGTDYVDFCRAPVD